MATTFLAATKAVTAASFVASLGMNTHLDFAASGYQNLEITNQAIVYLGIKNLRDCGMKEMDLKIWADVSKATGVQFDDYMPEGSPADMQKALQIAPLLAKQGLLNYLEGGNEEDDPYAVTNGNSLAHTAEFQKQVYELGQSLGLPVINMSFGAGWTALNNWQGHYDAVGDLSEHADYANAHTYPMGGKKNTDWTMRRLNGLANLAAKSRPVITTEIGWDENKGFAQSNIAKYVLNAAFDGWKNNNVKTYFYALYDDKSGRFGVMNEDGTPKPAGKALHALTTLLADPGADAKHFSPASLNYELRDPQDGDRDLLLQKSDGSFWLALWNEQQDTGQHHVATLAISSSTTRIKVYDPLEGSVPQMVRNDTSEIQLEIPDYPILIEIRP